MTEHPFRAPDAATRDFLADVLPRMLSADTALHNGDPAGRKEMWSRTDPVTLFGAAFTVTGWPAVGQVFDVLGAKFSDCGSFAIDVLAAGVSGDLGYVAAIERTTAAVDDRSPEQYALRVTTVFRREGGTWRAVHRHGDPFDAAATTVARDLRAPEDLSGTLPLD